MFFPRWAKIRTCISRAKQRHSKCISRAEPEEEENIQKKGENNDCYRLSKWQNKLSPQRKEMKEGKENLALRFIWRSASVVVLIHLLRCPRELWVPRQAWEARMGTPRPLRRPRSRCWWRWFSVKAAHFACSLVIKWIVTCVCGVLNCNERKWLWFCLCFVFFWYFFFLSFFLHHLVRSLMERESHPAYYVQNLTLHNYLKLLFFFPFV